MDTARHLTDRRIELLRKLRVLEKQSAIYGLLAPSSMVLEMEDIRKEIADIDRRLRENVSNSAEQ